MFAAKLHYDFELWKHKTLDFLAQFELIALFISFHQPIIGHIYINIYRNIYIDYYTSTVWLEEDGCTTSLHNDQLPDEPSQAGHTWKHKTTNWNGVCHVCVCVVRLHAFNAFLPRVWRLRALPGSLLVKTYLPQLSPGTPCQVPHHYSQSSRASG